MLSYKEALQTITQQLSAIQWRTESVKLEESIGRRLAEDVISDVNLPPFDHSAMDGFAVRFHKDVRRWDVIGELSAGNYKEFQIDYHNSVSIMTGAKMPAGADTVIPVENCDVSDNSISVSDDYNLKKGRNVRLLGEDLAKDSVAIASGEIIKANNISLAAACGKSTLKVYSKLNIGAFATGDELVPVDSIPANDQIRSSNLATLSASIHNINMNPVDFGLCADKRELIESRLSQALNSDIDMLITSGGVSVGKYDFIQDCLKAVGAEIQFWKVNIKPGKPLLFSTYKIGNKIIPVFSLPGNPLSCFVNFQLFVKQTLLMQYGDENSLKFSAKLRSKIKKGDGRLHFIMANSRFNAKHGCYEVESAGQQSSGTMSTMSLADCMFLFPEELTVLSKGDWVECIRI